MTSSTYSPSNDQELAAALERLAEIEPRPWQNGEWERTQHYNPPGPGWSARADDAAAGRNAEPHWRMARGDGYPLDVTTDVRLYVVPNHDSAAHIGAPSGYRIEWSHRGRIYQAFPSLHVYRIGDEWHDHRPATDDDTSLEQRAGRVVSTLYGCDDMPDGARTKLRAAILDAFRAWAADNAEAFALARARALNNAARSREEEAAKIARTLADTLAELRRIDYDDPDAPTY